MSTATLGSLLDTPSARQTSLHELAPYLGKMRPELAAWAIEAGTALGDRIYDPFCGSGTVLLEGSIRHRQVFGTDLNPYATLLSRAKIGASGRGLPSSGLEVVEKYLPRVEAAQLELSKIEVSDELRKLYHPETLERLLAWANVLRDEEDDFALSCLMGIAHHQRPGFLSFPASHTVPYLRDKRFPRDRFPELYQYRAVEPRLIKKIDRALSRLPPVTPRNTGCVITGQSSDVSGESRFDAIITSPPYMGQLHYGRDNRIRLELLGVTQWQKLDEAVSPRLNVFLNRSKAWLADWSRLLRPGGKLMVLVGDKTNTTRQPFAELVSTLVLEGGVSYRPTGTLVSPIPMRRRVRKGCEGSASELLLQFEIQK